MKKYLIPISLFSLIIILIFALPINILASYSIPNGNLVTNWDFETTTDPAYGSGASISRNTSISYNGSSSMAITGRTTGAWNSFNYDVAGVKFAKKYRYSLFVYTTFDGGADIQAGYSPWGKSPSNNYIWYYGAGDWVHINQNEWIQIYADFELRIVENKLYVVTIDALDGDESFALCKDYNGTDEGFDHLDIVRLAINATVNADIYVDCIALYPLDGEEALIPDQPTGHAGGDDASLIPGNMVQNATFDTKMFSPTLSGSGVWYYTSPEMVEIYDDYSQDGTDFGSCARFYNRLYPTCSLAFRSLNIWVKNIYTLTGYVSSRERTRGSIIVRMWSYYDKYTDENPVQRYPKADYVLPLENLVPGEWTRFEVSFGWKYNDDTGILSMQIYDWDSKEMITEVETTECTGLSSYEFIFATDPLDDNCLTDLYFDNYVMLNTTNHFKDDSGQETIDDDDPIVIINPTTSTTNIKDDEAAKSGCKSIIDAVPLYIFVIIGSSVILILKKHSIELWRQKDEKNY